MDIAKQQVKCGDIIQWKKMDTDPSEVVISGAAYIESYSANVDEYVYRRLPACGIWQGAHSKLSIFGLVFVIPKKVGIFCKSK